MGNIKKFRKKFETPKKLWNKDSIVAEKELMRRYGFKNKKEIWKIGTILNNFKQQAKKIIRTRGEQAEVEKQQLMNKLTRLGILKADSTLDDVLSLTREDLMERRLQTIVYKKNLATSQKQARQMIVHKHIVVGDKKITSPSYLLSVEEENQVGYSPYSKFQSEGHAEREVINLKLQSENTE